VAIDIGALQVGRAGDAVVSPTYGEIEGIRWDPNGYGLNVRIRARSGEEIILGHLQATPSGLRIGQEIKPGQVVGLMGSTGKSTGPHLHFEVRPPGVADRFVPGTGSAIGAVDPLSFYGGLPVTGSKTPRLPLSQFDYARVPLAPTMGDRARATVVGGLTGGANLVQQAAVGALTGGYNPLQRGVIGASQGAVVATTEKIPIAQTPFGPISIPAPGVLALKGVVGLIAVVLIILGAYGITRKARGK
jgi:hypothetical protein